MNTQHNGVSESGRVVGYAVLAAALVGTLASVFFGRKETKQEKAQRMLNEQLHVLEETADHTLAQLNQAVSGIRAQADRQSGKAAKKAAGLSRSTARRADAAVKSVAELAKDLERETKDIGAREAALGLGSDASQRARSMSKAFAERSIELLAEAQSAAPGWKNKAATTLSDTRVRGLALANTASERSPGVSKSAQKLANEAGAVGESVREEMRDRAPVVREKANLVFQDAAARGKVLVAHARDASPEIRERAPEVEERASQVAAKVAEAAQKLSSQARDRGPSLIESVGQQLTAALDDAQRTARPTIADVLSQATDAGKKLQGDVIPDVQHRIQQTTQKVGERTHATGASIAASGHEATDRIAHTSDAVEVRSRQVVSAAGRGSKEFGALLGWTAAAGGLVYVTFLSANQRERVKAAGKRIAREVGNVLQDIRGQNGEFS